MFGPSNMGLIPPHNSSWATWAALRAGRGITPALPHFGVHLESFRAGVKLSRTTSSVEEDITFMHTHNNPHSGSEPMPLQGPITRARALQF